MREERKIWYLRYITIILLSFYSYKSVLDIIIFNLQSFYRVMYRQLLYNLKASTSLSKSTAQWYGLDATVFEVTGSAPW